MTLKFILRNSLLFLLLIGTLALPTGESYAQEGDPSLETSAPDDGNVPRFGIVEAFWKPEESAELGVDWDRILFYWNELQPAGPDDWNTLHVLEEWLDDARAENREVMGLLKNTPPWATDAEPFSGVPRGLYLPVDDPGNLWAGYVRKVVQYYAPLGVHHWIIWNEPEIEVGVYGHEFSGSTRDYYQLLKVASQVAREHDPEVMIHLAGWSYWHDPNWLAQFLSIATSDPEGAANDYFFDAITLHIYFRVETVEELVQETWEIQRRYGLRKPIWINETNASPNLDALWPVERPNFQVTLEQQAWYVVQAHALGFGANASSIGVYKLLDILLPPGGESFGILRPDGSRRPAFDAYKTTIRYLKDFTFPVGRQQEKDFYSFAFKRPEGFTRVLWARNSNDQFLKVPAIADEARLISALGDSETTLRAYRGYYRIRLRGALCNPACDIGGAPVFLVEATNADLSVESIPLISPEDSILATPTPTAAVTEAATIDVPATVEVTPQPSQTLTATPAPSATPTIEPTATESPTLTATSIAETDSAIADADQPTLAAPSSSPPDMSGSSADSDSSVASWLFIGTAVLLGGFLVALLYRQRHSQNHS